MRIGIDTWFLYLLSKGDVTAQNIFESVVTDENEMIISTLTIAEITSVLLHKGLPNLAEKMVLKLICFPNIRIVSFDLEIAQRTARIKQSYGLSMIDAGILTTCIMRNCDVFIAEDSDFDTIKNSKIIKILKPSDLQL